jgi:hypothetical protein
MYTNTRKVSLEEVWKYDRKRPLETTEQLFNTSTLREMENPPGTIGPAEEILNTYGDRGSGLTLLIIGKHENLS